MTKITPPRGPKAFILETVLGELNGAGPETHFRVRTWVVMNAPLWEHEDWASEFDEFMQMAMMHHIGAWGHDDRCLLSWKFDEVHPEEVIPCTKVTLLEKDGRVTGYRVEEYFDPDFYDDHVNPTFEEIV